MDNPNVSSQLNSQEGLSQAGEQVEKNPEQELEGLFGEFDKYGLISRKDGVEALKQLILEDNLSKNDALLNHISTDNINN